MPIEVLYDDLYITVVNKPVNVLIHRSHYARNIKEPTLLDLLNIQTDTTYYPVHRIDRKTSGVLVLAKQKSQVAHFQQLFQENAIQKKYKAVVRGHIADELHINSPVKHPETQVYKDALTYCIPVDYGVLNIAVGPYKHSRYSLVALLPKTGRMHQLRIHMNKISHPIIGDTKYGDRFHNRMFAREFGTTELLLHAASLEFNHPFTKEHLRIETKMPVHWKQICARLDWHWS